MRYRSRISAILGLWALLQPAFSPAAYGQEEQQDEANDSYSATPATDKLPLPIPSPSKISMKLSRAQELLFFRVQMDESSYRVVSDNRRLFNLIHSYEKFVPTLCMPELFQTLDYRGSPKNGDCLEYLGRLLEVDVKNPIAICMRSGIDSPECRSAFAQQRVATLQEYSQLFEEDLGDLEIQLAKDTDTGKIKVLAGEYRAALRSFRSKKSAEAREQVLTALDKILNISCSFTKIGIRGDGGGAITARETPADPSDVMPTARPFEELMERLSADKSNTEHSGKATSEHYPSRIRFISETCDTYSKDALEIDAKHPLALCYRNGFYSPACIDAFRYAKKNKQPAAPPPGLLGSRPQGVPLSEF